MGTFDVDPASGAAGSGRCRCPGDHVHSVVSPCLDIADESASRGRRPLPQRGRRYELVVILLAAGLMTLLALTLRAHLGATDLRTANGLLSDATVAPLFGAALLCLLRGRWTVRPDVSLAGGGLLVLAVMRATLGDLRTLAPNSATVPYLNVAILAIGGGGAIALLGLAAHDPLARSRRPRRQLVVAGVIAGAGTGVGTIGAALGAPALDQLGFAVLVACTSAGWAIVATVHARARRSALGWLPAVLVLTTLASLARIPAALAPQNWVFAPGAVALLAAFVALIGSAYSLLAWIDVQRLERVRLSHAIRTADRAIEHREAVDQETLHDVRSLLAGVRAAAASLTGYEDRIDATVRRRLQQSVSAELERLQQLLDPEPAHRVETVVLPDALSSVIVAEVVQGLQVRVEGDSARAIGRPADIATIVANLLGNARVHGGGARVTVHTRSADGMIQLEFRDDGPGIPPDEMASIFDRGRRGSRSRQEQLPGSGLGLFTARRLARAMDGDLSVHRRPEGGSAFVLTLPSAEELTRAAGPARPARTLMEVGPSR
jgi:signal transduction histidine kinase